MYITFHCFIPLVLTMGCFLFPAVAPLPYARAVHPIGDDGSWAPGKYDPIAAPILPYAAHIAAPYAAHIAAPYAAHIAPYAAAPVAHWAHPVSDDGSYWAGKYGPEWQ